MHIAASNNSMECLDTLYAYVKDKGAICKQDNKGYTPLHYAVKFGDFMIWYEIIYLIILSFLYSYY